MKEIPNERIRSSSGIIVRPMRPKERSQVETIMRRAFPLPADLFFSWSGQVLVAEQEEVLLGGIVLKTFPLPGGRRGGLVKWIFADPNARGLGAGQALVEEGFSHLDAQGCDEIFACVEGNNSSSAKLFATRSFSILSPGEQFRRYGLRMFLVWLRAFHFCDIGHFLWVRPPEKGPDSPMLQWWGGLLFNLLFGWLALWRQQGFGVFDSVAFGALPAALLLLFGARHLTMLAAAAVQNLRLRYRVWESAFPVMLIIGLVFGGLFPAPGGLYPRGHDWRYRDLLPKLGGVALAGSLTVLLLTWGAWTLREFAGLGTSVQRWLDYFLFAAVPLALFDTVIAFFPFVGFNGRRLWDWNRPLWVLFSVLAVLILFV